MSKTHEQIIADRQATCDCSPSFHVCTAIAESKRIAEDRATEEERERHDRLAHIRAETIAQAKVLKNIFPAVADFCDNVIELLELEELADRV